MKRVAHVYNCKDIIMLREKFPIYNWLTNNMY